MQQQFVLNTRGGLEGTDFRALGFKCGLEIHHQILTDKKLFCRCPAGMYSNQFQAEVLRHMRPTLSELGEYDGTALMEFKTKKEIIYRLNKDSVCTYEMDDTPPFPINRSAIDIAIEIALLLNCKIVDEIHIIRKQYLDGSIPTGFQRTAIVGWDGWIPYKGRKIGITQLALEEDACREVSDLGHTITFMTDRLSMPLIEIVTESHMLDPVEAAEVGGILGTLLRLTGKVRRGYGSGRQDVNVSVNGGTRVEIKGVPRLGYIPRLTAFEAKRQKSLLELKSHLEKRGFRDSDDIEYKTMDLTDKVNMVQHKPMLKNLPKDGAVHAVCFKNMKGVFTYKLNQGWSFADEVAGRVRVIACLDKMPNIAHTDPGNGYYLGKDNTGIMFELLSCNNKDVITLVWGPTKDVETAVSEIIIRVKEIFQGVINETRQHRVNGLSDFERILPGPDRMYPDTDSPPTAITEDWIQRISSNLPETPWVKMERFESWKISEEVGWNLLHSKYLNNFEKAAEYNSQNAKLLAKLVLQDIPHEMKKAGFSLDNEAIDKFLEFVAKNHCSRKNALSILKNALNGESMNNAIKGATNRIVEKSELDTVIRRVVNRNDGRQEINFLTGQVLNEIEGNVEPSRVREMIAESID